jgi:hypothetical protein
MVTEKLRNGDGENEDQILLEFFRPYLHLEAVNECTLDKLSYLSMGHGWRSALTVLEACALLQVIRRKGDCQHKCAIRSDRD